MRWRPRLAAQPDGRLCRVPLYVTALEPGGEPYTVRKHFSNSFERTALKSITVNRYAASFAEA